jgi:stage III sporulation protein SpoIIIAA
VRQEITDNLDVLLAALPQRVSHQVREIGRTGQLLEVILDLGRVPTARYLDGEVVLSESEVSSEDIHGVVKHVGAFDEDNRAGIQRTLHRISAIRNRQGQAVGLTCRVGRAVYGTIEIVQDVIESGISVLLLGRPGVGKTTMLREAARVLAESRRVVVVDTSNEIGGDGDIPHPAVGRARRMQVQNPVLQHEVMIEAVENHNPETIVIDEIGREAEALAARTIAERGVQLIGTAHGNTLDNLLLNPTLADLVGGIESVTLSDEEARRRGTQKTVLERRSPPTFDVLIEILQREHLTVHNAVSDSVDALLRGEGLKPEVRYRADNGELVSEKASSSTSGRAVSRGQRGRMPWRGDSARATTVEHSRQRDRAAMEPAHIFSYGINRQRLERAARRLRVPLRIVDELGAAQGLVTLKSHYRRRQRPVSDAEATGMPIYVLRSNTQHQIENLLLEMFDVGAPVGGAQDPVEHAMSEVNVAIRAVRKGTRFLDLQPQGAGIRRRQHKIVRQAKLVSHSYGEEPNRRVRVFRP